MSQTLSQTQSPSMTSSQTITASLTVTPTQIADTDRVSVIDSNCLSNADIDYFALTEPDAICNPICF